MHWVVWEHSLCMDLPPVSLVPMLPWLTLFFLLLSPQTLNIPSTHSKKGFCFPRHKKYISSFISFKMMVIIPIFCFVKFNFSAVIISFTVYVIQADLGFFLVGPEWQESLNNSRWSNCHYSEIFWYKPQFQFTFILCLFVFRLFVIPIIYKTLFTPMVINYN